MCSAFFNIVFLPFVHMSRRKQLIARPCCGVVQDTSFLKKEGHHLAASEPGVCLFPFHKTTPVASSHKFTPVRYCTLPLLFVLFFNMAALLRSRGILLSKACALCAGQAGTAAAEKFHQAFLRHARAFPYTLMKRTYRRSFGD